MKLLRAALGLNTQSGFIRIQVHSLRGIGELNVRRKQGAPDPGNQPVGRDSADQFVRCRDASRHMSSKGAVSPEVIQEPKIIRW